MSLMSKSTLLVDTDHQTDTYSETRWEVETKWRLAAVGLSLVAPDSWVAGYVCVNWSCS